MKISGRGVVAALLAVAVAALCVRLGFWQLDRLEQRRARNAALEGAMALPVLELRDSFGAVVAAPDAYLYRRVRVRGVYDAAREVVLRGRTDGGNPGVHLTAPLVIAGDTAVMVNRGWAPAPDAVTVDPRRFAEPGRREVDGFLLAAPATDDAAPLVTEVEGVRVHTFARLPLDSLRAAGPYALLPLYVQQVGGQAGEAPRRVPLPPLGEGAHLGYAVQWFSFAAIALVGFALLATRQRRGAR
jgi:surfeit locus 1 family protein